MTRIYHSLTVTSVVSAVRLPGLKFWIYHILVLLFEQATELFGALFSVNWENYNNGTSFTGLLPIK